MTRDRTQLANRLIPGGHEMEVRVYYEDTDFSGVVYHSNYLKYMERSRTEWLRHLGIHHTDLQGQDSAFAIHRMALKYGPPARIDDLLSVRTTLVKLTGARSFLRQEVWREEPDGRETLLCGADVEVAFINHGGGAKRFPDDLRAKLEGQTSSAQSGPAQPGQPQTSPAQTVQAQTNQARTGAATG